MRKNNLLFITFVVFMMLGGCAKKEIANKNSAGNNIICFGDSITFGYGVNPGEDYPSLLAKTAPCAVINAGIDGDTTGEAISRMDSDVLQRDPRLVIIEFGGNDFLRKIPKETTMENIRNMVDSIQAKGAMVAIADISSGMFLAEYRAALQKIAQEKDAIFIPSILSGIITNPAMKSDFFHPNAKGYQLVAEKIHRYITPYLVKK
jgi:acyl-CoA thioesterase-1